jgi:collagenase-like PrtC family protease
MEKIELLLPVGNWDNLRAAVENGADAVYLGVSSFNARRRASNFKIEELSEVVDYCHGYGVRVYCTLIKNCEVRDFLKVVKKLYDGGVDAVIIQEIAFIDIIKKNFKGLEVHLSTQAAISNTYFKSLVSGCDRIILPREIGCVEVEEFVTKFGKPVEIFVQGAMCFSYSGKCLFSSFIGGRSGNRGLCAQPCRKKYNGRYKLSMKDMCLIEEVPKIIESGVCSLKIEGRLRSAKYVAAAAKLYRKAIDSYYAGKFEIDDELFLEMKLAFNRGFTKGYYVDDGADKVFDDKPMGRGLYLGEIEDEGILLKNDLRLDDGVGIWREGRVDGAVIKSIIVDDSEVEFAAKGTLVKLDLRVEIGDEIYLTSSVKKPKEIEFVSNEAISVIREKVKKIVLSKVDRVEGGGVKFYVKVYNYRDAKALIRKVECVYLNIDLCKDGKFGVFIPRILDDGGIERAYDRVKELGVKKLLIGDLGFYGFLKSIGVLDNFDVVLDYTSNVFNDYDLMFYDKVKCIISPELSFEELKEFKRKNFINFVHGKLVLMNTKYQYLPSRLKDNLGYTFEVRGEGDYFQILNSFDLGLFEKVNLMKSDGLVNFYFDLDFDVVETIDLYRKILAGKKVKINYEGFTRGHFEKGVK